MSDKIDVAVKSAKAMQVEMVQWENRLMAVQNEIQSLNRQKDALQKTIDEKVNDAHVRFNERDAQSRALESKINEDRKKLEEDKISFQQALASARQERAQIDKDKEEAKILKLRADQVLDSVNNFVIAVQKAFQVLPQTR